MGMIYGPAMLCWSKHTPRTVVMHFVWPAAVSGTSGRCSSMELYTSVYEEQLPITE